MTDYVPSDGDEIDARVLRALRNGIIDRFALRNRSGFIAHCRCSPRNNPAQRKVIYGNREDAWLAARALVQLPNAEPIRLYRCDVVVSGGWHHTSLVPYKNPRAGPRLVLPPNWCASPPS